MKTTLGKIREYHPCTDGWKKLAGGLGTSELDTEVTILQILDINGPRDAFWALRTQEFSDYCLVLADVAEEVLHHFEKKHPEDKRPRLAIEAIRKWKSGEISRNDLRAAAYAAAAAADAAAATAYAAAAYAADAAAAAATAYAATAYAATAYAAAADAADAAAAAATAYAARGKFWEKAGAILKSHLELK